MAVSEALRQKYRPTIGIETHVQLNTKTKLFSAVANDAREAAPNSLISHIDVGLPGALPVLNQTAIELCVRAALALNTQPQKFSRFERKHYFYPDLPKGYQITQYQDSIIKGGYLEVPLADGSFKVEIERANLEEDAGKNTHPDGADYSLVDLNRAGTPLLEIVSRPDIHSPAQAKAFAREMWLTMKYSGLTGGDLYLGQVRFDVNVSVSQDNSSLGTRTEIKNLNSFRSVENAVAYEIDRQIELLEKGQAVVQETRGWDEAKQKSSSQRSKEEAHDYRYMPEPDIPPLQLEDDFIAKNSQSLPISLSQWRQRLRQAGVEWSGIETLLEAEAEAEDLGVSYLERLQHSLDDKDQTWYLSTWFINVDIPMRRAGRFVRPMVGETDYYYEVYKRLVEKKLSSTNARILIEQLFTNPQPVEDVEKLAVDLNLYQLSDETELGKIVEAVIKDNPKVVADIKNGEAKAIGFLVGQVMAKSQGKANPQLATDIIKNQLGM